MTTCRTGWELNLKQPLNCNVRVLILFYFYLLNKFLPIDFVKYFNKI
jgi:hypothetical protein